MTEKKNIGIIDCDFGNLASLVNAIKFLKFDYQVLEEPSNFEKITHLILPGVGSFAEASKKIHKSGWDKAIKDYIDSKKPFLGICLGMQLMFDRGLENGNEKGLGLFDGVCEKFKKYPNLSLPHIGFNLVNHQSSKIWKDIPVNSPFYFVHSFRVIKNNISKHDKDKKYSTTYYGEEFISFIENQKIFGAQFHPEKSHKTGLKLINNFIKEIA